MDAHSNVIANLDRQVNTALQASGLTGGKRLVVAVSGGPDSLALLSSLSHLRGELGLELHGAHLDHGLRSEASEADARFVAETFRSLGLESTLDLADVSPYRKEQRLSLEEAAREVRYEFLFRVAAEQRADAIALGHTSDDQAETVLMNIIRGSGLSGLRGMQTSTRRCLGDEEALLLRPLLRTSRNQTLAYCRALDLEPRMDESNMSRELTRNRVRMDLLPLLEEFNPSIRDALTRLSRSAVEGMEYLDSMVDAVWGEVARREGDDLVLDKDAFDGLPSALKPLVLRKALSVTKGGLKGVQGTHIDEMVRLMDGPVGSSLHLPRGIRFTVGYSHATIGSDEERPCPLPSLESEHLLNVPGETVVCGWRVDARILERDATEQGVDPSFSRTGPASASSQTQTSEGSSAGKFPGGADYLMAQLGYDDLGTQVYLRSRRQGDRFQPLGMSGRKKLQDFMVDAKIPRSGRDRVPLLVTPRGIAWVAGWRIAEWAKVNKAERRVLELRLARR